MFRYIVCVQISLNLHMFLITLSNNLYSNDNDLACKIQQDLIYNYTHWAETKMYLFNYTSDSYNESINLYIIRYKLLVVVINISYWRL